MRDSDHIYIGVPWKDGGRTLEGCDCVGLVSLWLAENYGFAAPVPNQAHAGRATELLAGRTVDEAKLERGDVVFFGDGKTVQHVGVWLGDGKLLQTLRGVNSRVENGLKMSRRLKMIPMAAVPAREAELLAQVLTDVQVGGWVAVILFVISIVLSLASALLMPKLARVGNKYGKYGFDSLITQTSTEIPLPDLLGSVVTAGNSPYTQLSDKNLTSTAADQRANKIVIFAGGPVEGLDLEGNGLTINGLTYTDKFFRNATSAQGFTLDPAQTKAEAHTGTINGETMVPSVTFYPGTHGVAVPVDVRADYDRTFPLYGFSGCAYAVFRLIDSSKFPSFNVTARVKGRLVRQVGATGFSQTGVSGQTIGTGDGSTRRFQPAVGSPDIIACTALTVDGVAWTELSASNQSGNIWYLNRTKGYFEFPDNIPAAGKVIAGDFTFYPRLWSSNPADHIAYLLTEIGRGNGFNEDKINWTAFYAAWQYYDVTVDWTTSSGVVSGKRYTTNYAVDFRKPIQEHLRALLDACRSVIFVSDGKFVLKPIQADTSVFSFDTSNILRDSFTAELADRAERPNRIKAFYHTSDTYQAETEAVREDIADQLAREPRAGNGGVVEENLKFPAVDNQSQAERLAEIHLRTQVNSRLSCSFKTTVLGLAIEVGDVVDVTHPSQPTWAAKLFRVENFKLDDDGRIELQLSEYFAGAEI